MAKKYFGMTFLEILLVIIILSILIAAFLGLQIGGDKDFIKAQTCGSQIR